MFPNESARQGGTNLYAEGLPSGFVQVPSLLNGATWVSARY